MNRNQFTELCHPKNSQPLPTYSAWTFYNFFFSLNELWDKMKKKKKTEKKDKKKNDEVLCVCI